MGKALSIPVKKAMRKLGQDISDARRRRRIPVKLLAERADISQRTLVKIEQGDASVGMASYAGVIFALGMIERLADLVDARHDLTGRALEEEHLPKRVRLPSKDKNEGTQ